MASTMSPLCYQLAGGLLQLRLQEHNQRYLCNGLLAKESLFSLVLILPDNACCGTHNLDLFFI